MGAKQRPAAKQAAAEIPAAAPAQQAPQATRQRPPSKGAGVFGHWVGRLFHLLAERSSVQAAALPHYNGTLDHGSEYGCVAQLINPLQVLYYGRS
jgi:hypothetical protein